MRPRPRQSRLPNSAPAPAGRLPATRRCEARWPRGSSGLPPPEFRQPLHILGDRARELPNSMLHVPPRPYSVSFAAPGLLQARLLEDCVQSTRRHVQARLPRHCNGSWLVWVLVLTVATSRSRQPPPVLLEKPDEFSDLHLAVDVMA